MLSGTAGSGPFLITDALIGHAGFKHRTVFILLMGKVKAQDDIFFTQAMAEVLEKQGFFEDALMIYKILADTSPWDETLNDKIQRLKGLAKSRGNKSGK